VKEIQVCLNKGPVPLQRGDNHKNVKIGVGSFNNLPQNHWASLNRLGINHHWGKGIQVSSNEGNPSRRRGTCSSKRVKIH
jgi:hypothetical protein